MPNDNETPSSTVRFDPAVRRRLDQYAEKNRQSMNAAMNSLLDQALPADDGAAPVEVVGVEASWSPDIEDRPGRSRNRDEVGTR